MNATKDRYVSGILYAFPGQNLVGGCQREAEARARNWAEGALPYSSREAQPIITVATARKTVRSANAFLFTCISS
jgi:hypothetical protein